jgi:hypothetical protein
VTETPAELRAENEKLIRWHHEDGAALAEMRATIARLRTELAAASSAVPAPATDRAAGPGCVCGEPSTLGTVHRTDGPCHVDDRAALRDRIAETLATADGWKFADGFQETSLVFDRHRKRADVVLDVLPASLDRGAFVPPSAEGLPPGALDSAADGASALDAWARDPHGRNFLAHALVQLARDGWLRTQPGDGFEPVRDRETPEPQDPAVLPASLDRADVLREAADGFDAHAEKLLSGIGDKAVFVAKALQDQTAVWREAAETLRRMTDETPQPAEAHPPTTTWKVESPRRSNWASWGATYDDRDWARERYESATANAPDRLFRLVRATTIYTVEAEPAPAVVAQPDGEA